MAIYDPTNPLHVEQARRYLERLLQGDEPFEIKREEKKRTSLQNRFIHAAIGLLAIHLGLKLDYVKDEYFKKECNPDIFVRRQYDPNVKRDVEVVRSSASLTVDEMSTAIDRFLRWCVQEFDFYIPDGDEYHFLKQMEVEVARHKQWLYGRESR